MIPDSIARSHVLEALAQIDRDGVLPGRNGLKYSVWSNGRPYPPKLVISLACKAATGRLLPSGMFSGGTETNTFLQRLGFEIRRLDGEAIEGLKRRQRTGAPIHQSKTRQTNVTSFI